VTPAGPPKPGVSIEKAEAPQATNSVALVEQDAPMDALAEPLPAPQASPAKPGKGKKDAPESMAIAEGAVAERTVRSAMGMRYGRGVGALAMRSASVEPSRERYAHIDEPGFAHTKDQPLSTFSVDVDTASYSNVRRMLRDGQRPPADAVRVEEMINYFDYDAPPPSGSAPIAIHTEVSSAPWAPDHRLVRVALRARDLEQDADKPRNLVFLVDVSGSMQSEDKLPLLRRGLGMLARELRPEDRVAIVVYAGASGVVLPATSGADRASIEAALGQLEAGGSTNGGAGIELAYKIAQEHFVRDGINRVILATDGDFNVGVTSEGELTRLIEEKRKTGVFLTVLGFGTGNLNDSGMEQLADKGNGNYAYIDSIEEAHKVLVREAGSTLVTVAKDVKIQVEWNPAHVASYRLIGYENRKLADRDFNDDEKDAGEMGAGHRVTALYDVQLKRSAALTGEVDPLRYQGERALTDAAASPELLTVKVRYKQPNDSASALIERRVQHDAKALADASSDQRLAAAVAAFGMALRGSEHRGRASFALARELASSVAAQDQRERLELIDMIDAAAKL
jgi:Ca-activated chloride channel family protein